MFELDEVEVVIWWLDGWKGYGSRIRAEGDVEGGVDLDVSSFCT